MKTCNLIVHADDFGLTSSVNEGIIDAHINGILTSCSVMANGQAFDEAIELASTAPTLDIGVHLTLVEEAPLSPPYEIPTILGNNNKMLPNAKSVFLRYLKKQLDMEHVRVELEAQIIKVKSTGLPISHIDGHQHLHVLPDIFAIVRGLARKHKIPAVRIPREKIRKYMFRNITGYKRILELMALNTYASLCSADLNRPDSFAGFYFGGNLSLDNLQSLLSYLPKHGNCELMCHPGASNENGDYSQWQYDWKAELDALKNSKIRQQLESQGVSLISYRDLNAGH